MTYQVAIKASIPQLIENRVKSLELLKVSIDNIIAAFHLADDACIGDGCAGYDLKNIVSDSFKYGCPTNSDEMVQKLTVALDRRMWRSMMVNTPLWSLMDAEARKKFEKEMEGVPPEANEENLRATMLHYFTDADNIFRRSLVNVFQELDRAYKSHDGFKIGARLVLTNIQSDHGSFNHYASDKVRDLDRVFWVLDGKEFPETYNSSLCSALSHAFQTASGSFSRGAGFVETDYFRVRFFKNGSIHIWFKRDDLVERANRLIAEHFGMAVGASADAQAKGKKKADPTKGLNLNAKEDYYPTPSDVADLMVDYAQIQDGNRICEPSAGEGAILEKVIARIANNKISDTEIKAGELNYSRHKKITDMIGGTSFQRQNSVFFDWLEHSASKLYDRIIMNPPFSSLQWVRHTLHAMNQLAPGGRLVALLPVGASAGKFKDEWHALLSSAVEVHDLPKGTFKSAGTMIETRIYVFDKD